MWKKINPKSRTHLGSTWLISLANCLCWIFRSFSSSIDSSSNIVLFNAKNEPQIMIPLIHNVSMHNFTAVDWQFVSVSINRWQLLTRAVFSGGIFEIAYSNIILTLICELCRRRAARLVYAENETLLIFFS